MKRSELIEKYAPRLQALIEKAKAEGGSLNFYTTRQKILKRYKLSPADYELYFASKLLYLVENFPLEKITPKKYERENKAFLNELKKAKHRWSGNEIILMYKEFIKESGLKLKQFSLEGL